MFSYKIFDDGYDIVNDGVTIITQREPNAKIFDKDGSYEDNAKIHISKLHEPEPMPDYSDDILDENTEAMLEMQANIQYLVDLAEINMEG